MRHTPSQLLSIDEVRAIAAVRDALGPLPAEARLRVLRRLRQLDAGSRGERRGAQHQD